MSSEVSLTEMPEVVINRILEELDFCEIQVLRKVCLDLRNYIDDSKPDSKVFRVEVVLTPEKIDIRYARYDVWNADVHVEYRKSELGCLVVHQEKEIFLENEEFVKIAIQDLKLTLREQKSALYEFEISSECGPDSLVFHQLGEIFKTGPRPFRTENFSMNTFYKNDLFLILPCFDANDLQYLSLYYYNREDFQMDFNEIVKLEQWKKAKRLLLEGYIELEKLFGHLEHFETVYVRVKVVTTGELTRLKEIFLHSPTILNFYIPYDSLADPLPFGVPVEGPNREIDGAVHWYFCIPDSKKVLSISYDSRFHNIHFLKIDVEKVPDYAIVQM